MWNKPTQTRLEKVPRLFETEPVPMKEKTIHLHFFMGGCDWYVVEFDGEDTFFGYVILNGDHQNAEWGYFSFQELSNLKIGWLEVDCEIEEVWRDVQVQDVEQIKTWE